MTQIKEHPILFSAEMVRAILSGEKTQTRRVIKSSKQFPNNVHLRTDVIALPHYVWFWDGINERVGNSVKCPYGKPGDRLWVRESGELLYYPFEHDWRTGQDIWVEVGWAYPDGEIRAVVEYDPPLTEWVGDCDRTSRPSIHMPRWASRITLEITDIRVERVQGITEEASLAEGIRFWIDDHLQSGRGADRRCRQAVLNAQREGRSRPATASNRDAFALAWNSINAKRGYGWDANPYVWVIEFRRVEG